MYGLKRYDEALEISKQAYELATGDIKTVAMMYMANALVMQQKYAEALKLYIEIQGRSPCRSVQVDQLQEGISRCMDYLGKSNSRSKPS
jgi:tetratricopeptide (TPR) repeat protein